MLREGRKGGRESLMALLCVGIASVRIVHLFKLVNLTLRTRISSLRVFDEQFSIYVQSLNSYRNVNKNLLLR